MRSRSSCFTNRLIIALFVFCLFGNGAVHGQQDSKRVMTGVRFDGNTSVISVVVKGGPADRAGIKVGDELVSADENFVVQSSDLVNALQGKVAGDIVVLEIKRGNQFRFFQLRLIEAVKGDVEIDETGKVSQAPEKLGILNELGPELTVKDWTGIKNGSSTKLGDNRGKVIYVMFFQTDCYNCLREGLKEYKSVQQRYLDDPDVLVMAIQTPFQNFELNTFGAARNLFKEKGIEGPIGHEGASHRRSATFANYKALGTPWFIVMDTEGVVRYNDSSLPLDEAIVLFAQLKAGINPVRSEDKNSQESNAQQPGKQSDKKPGDFNESRPIKQKKDDSRQQQPDQSKALNNNR